MKKIIFIVEKTNTGYSAYAEDERYPAYTTGGNMEELKTNMLDAINTVMDIQGKPEIGADKIGMKVDLKQFFTYYKVINARILSERIGINYTLFSQYVTGKKIPSVKQTEKILKGVKVLGQELSSLEFA